MEDTPSMTTPSRDSTLTFREVTEENWRAVANLSPKDGQIGNLAPNTLVGMLMMAIWDPDEAYYIWRFMIDGRYQGLGYGRRGVEFAIAHIRQHNPQAKQLGVMSTPPEGKMSGNPAKNVKPEDSPYKFYQKLGFRETAPPDEDGEIMMSIDL
ncbi:GNAT family N-acetyltransferase [Aspergillus thermomutatus]|uniref:N-acetyltransferase domain-containing protein n=1 Tax=Aspergillus thermomutatus TaxID=41047 RepID=A0A397GK50_ASPTH|nr:uncharacterized protein CDV56_102150 [Aspergillus thermomutatus]RHZ49826.1 hypothetical protein CDV56_102150 [Aspergillus thermomutatus]